MATFTWEVYSDTPAWHTVNGNTVVFSGTGGLTTPITVGSWNDETHLGSGDPGTDQCGTGDHMNNVKFITSTQFDNGSGTQTLNDTNLTADECTLAIHFDDGSSVATTNGRFYTFDGTTETNEAIGVEVYAFEQGIGASVWDYINDDSTNFGGDNTDERLPLTNQSGATEHTFYIAVTARPESVGSKTQFDFGIALTYS